MSFVVSAVSSYSRILISYLKGPRICRRFTGNLGDGCVPGIQTPIDAKLRDTIPISLRVVFAVTFAFSFLMSSRVLKTCFSAMRRKACSKSSRPVFFQNSDDPLKCFSNSHGSRFSLSNVLRRAFRFSRKKSWS